MEYTPSIDGDTLSMASTAVAKNTRPCHQLATRMAGRGILDPSEWPEPDDVGQTATHPAFQLHTRLTRPADAYIGRKDCSPK